jgi:hypothetical protein
MEPGSDDRDRIHPNASSPPKTDADVAPLIQKVGAPSIAQIEKLIGELHEARNLLESERERIQRETARYIKFTQMASSSPSPSSAAATISSAARCHARRS